IASFGVADLLTLGLALELGWRTFRLFPGAAATARKALLVITALTGWAVVVGAPSDTDFRTLSLVIPRRQRGTHAPMCAMLLVAYWYRVPIHPFHAALLTSFAAYLAIYSTLLSLIGVRAVSPYLAVLADSNCALVACWWVYAAWKRQGQTSTIHVA